ncbi:sulfurtransferase [Anaerobacillus alkaliphilus]|uniref:Sulfurtransferase n=1 Tax=Anaerobacillus alkaliphilus TaxID=1548597 RepID=A0A4V1LFQ8_9BACI|nr:sulfurtransferase [Anaerobacillus alkaliphilus]RXI96139.1 sulfurtransferase [Anaerobacillus alkaliphilus]
MLIILLGIVTIVFLFFLYERYVPIIGIRSVDVQTEKFDENVVLLDVRDYNIAFKSPVKEVSIHLPLAYLKRNFQDVRGKNVVVIASDQLLVNLSARFLRRRGIRIIGYYTQQSSGQELSTVPCSKNSCIGMNK